MTARQLLLVRAIGVAVFAFLAGAAFAAYLKPGMLIEFANLILCT